MLGDLRGGTIVTPDLDATVAAYGEHLGYRGAVAMVDAVTAQGWAAPAAEGCRMATLHPASGNTRFLRFVESAVPDSYRPLAHPGWNAVEIIVRDLHDLAKRLAGSPFAIIGAPAVLDFDFTDRISAMQVRGPAGEILYLTEVTGDVPGFDLPTAASDVDSPFVAILATLDFDTAVAWYAEQAGKPAPDSFRAKVEVISAVHGLPAGHRHRLTAVTLPHATLVEIDDFPAATTVARPLAACGLAVGIAIASFACDDPREAGRVIEGPSGELVELIAQ